MPTYRLYRLTSAGLIAGPPEDFEAADDAAAMARLQATVEEPGVHGCELWERARRVAVLATGVSR